VKTALPPLLSLLLAVAVIFLLWPWPVFFPFKLLVVFFHEASHALMTVATGGTVRELAVDAMQGGHVVSAGGNRFLILSSGYLGSLAWGAAIYLAASASRLDKVVMVVLALVIATVCALFVRDAYAALFAGATALVMLILAIRGSHAINDAGLRLVGLTSLLYAPLDIWSDTIARRDLMSDARMLGDEFGGSGVLWGSAWLTVSVLVIGLVTWTALRLEAPRREASPYRGSADWSDDA